MGTSSPEAPLCCFCAAPSPLVELAGILESVVSRMSSNKEAAPFLRPLLPVVEGAVQSGAQVQHVLLSSAFMEHEYLTQSQDLVSFSQSQPSTQPSVPLAPADDGSIEALGLLGVLDKVRACGYSAAGQLAADLLTMREVLARKLVRLGAMPSIEGRAVVFVESMLASSVDSSGSGGGGGAPGTQGFVVLEVFDRLVQEAESFLYSIKSHTGRAERRMAAHPSQQAETTVLSVSAAGVPWRGECHTELYHNQLAKARPMADWLEYLGKVTRRKKQPRTPSGAGKIKRPSSEAGEGRRSRSGSQADGPAPCSGSKIVELVGIEQLLSDVNASEVLDGMRCSALREGVTNMEEHTLAHCVSIDSNVAEDEERWVHP